MNASTILLGLLALTSGLTAGISVLAGAGPEPVPVMDVGLPLPPIPPHIAQGAAYNRCLALIATDPAAAIATATRWRGGDGPDHCRALALLAQGDLASGAAALDALAARSPAPAIARATVFGEATQAWLLIGDNDKALASANAALELAPDDPDLLIGHAQAVALRGQDQQAIDDLDQAIDIDPLRADALSARAAAWSRLGQPELAADDTARAVAAGAAPAAPASPVAAPPPPPPPPPPRKTQRKKVVLFCKKEPKNSC